MKFDWNEFTKIDFANYCAKAENNMLAADDYVGCVRVGNLCFDLLVRFDENEKLWLSYDMYVGGVDTGYGYADLVNAERLYTNQNPILPKNPTYPYDYAEGGEFDGTMIWMAYEDFQKYAEAKFEEFITTWPYKEASLIEKANEPLNIW